MIVLGLASLATAWATFQAALYDGKQAASYAEGQSLRTEAESLYLEANQQYTQDAATLGRLAELRIAADAGDAVAQAQYDELAFMNVSDDLAAAIERADEANAADPVYYTSPLADEEYQHALFGGYAETAEIAEQILVQGQEFSALSDRLKLATTVLAISLFLLGIAAVVRRYSIKTALTLGGSAILVLGIVWTLAVPTTWL